jgi:molecular chaperone GrpE
MMESENRENTNPTATGSETDGAASESAPSEVETLKSELKEQQSKYLYLYAEFDTFKKRVIKERSDLLKFGYESFARELLQVADNLDRALEHTDTTSTDGLVSGIKLVNQQLKDTLSKFGISAIPAVGQKFDPERHEAVGQEKVSDEKNAGEVDGTVIREHQKGYTLHGRLLRPARVVIATR